MCPVGSRGVPLVIALPTVRFEMVWRARVLAALFHYRYSLSTTAWDGNI